MFLRGCMTFRAKATSSRQSVWIYSVTHCFMLRRVSRSESSPTRFIEAAITSSSLIATAFSHAACSASSLARCLASHSAFRLASACSCSCRLRSSSAFLSAFRLEGEGESSAFCCIWESRAFACSSSACCRSSARLDANSAASCIVGLRSCTLSHKSAAISEYTPIRLLHFKIKRHWAGDRNTCPMPFVYGGTAQCRSRLSFASFGENFTGRNLSFPSQ